jgi:predicted  nucleic acid-binding Zn-ribbon protein
MNEDMQKELEEAKKTIESLRQNYEDLEFQYFALVLEKAKSAPKAPEYGC